MSGPTIDDVTEFLKSVRPAATERADQLRAKGVFTVGPYAVEVAA